MYKVELTFNSNVDELDIKELIKYITSKMTDGWKRLESFSIIRDGGSHIPVKGNKVLLFVTLNQPQSLTPPLSNMIIGVKGDGFKVMIIATQYCVNKLRLPSGHMLHARDCHFTTERRTYGKQMELYVSLGQPYALVCNNSWTINDSDVNLSRPLKDEICDIHVAMVLHIIKKEMDKVNDITMNYSLSACIMIVVLSITKNLMWATIWMQIYKSRRYIPVIAVVVLIFNWAFEQWVSWYDFSSNWRVYKLCRKNRNKH